MKKTVVLLTICILGMTGVKAQSDYKSAIGGRLGTPISVSYKYFFTKPGALEGYAGFSHPDFGFNFFRIGGMYQHHFDIKPVEGLKWYVGGGVLIDFFSYNRYYNNQDFASTAVGINAVGGVDYKFKQIPLNLSADWTPTVLIGDNLYYSSNFRGGYLAVSVRYVLK
jgi:hypothetical protein